MIKKNLEKLLEYLFYEQKVNIGSGYRWKESVMQTVQQALKDRGDSINSQEEFEEEVEQQIEKIKEDMELTFEMIRRTLYQVPFEAFKNQ